jgi:hypothetical protein
MINSFLNIRYNNPSFLQFYYFATLKSVQKMLILKDIPQLVADDFRLANGSIYIGMGMTIYPYIDTAVGNEVTQFRSEGTVDD